MLKLYNTYYCGTIPPNLLLLMVRFTANYIELPRIHYVYSIYKNIESQQFDVYKLSIIYSLNMKEPTQLADSCNGGEGRFPPLLILLLGLSLFVIQFTALLEQYCPSRLDIANHQYYALQMT